jgi:hypothetical protein
MARRPKHVGAARQPADEETLLSASCKRIEAAADAAKVRMAHECEQALEAERLKRRAMTMLRAPTGTHSFGEILHAIAAVPDD